MPIVMQEHCVFTAPGKRAAVKGILAAFQAGLVTVKHGGGAGKGIQQGGSQFQPAHGPLPLGMTQPVMGAPVPVVAAQVFALAQQGQDTGIVVGPRLFREE